jgi:hypothetical protein
MVEISSLTSMIMVLLLKIIISIFIINCQFKLQRSYNNIMYLGIKTIPSLIQIIQKQLG